MKSFFSPLPADPGKSAKYRQIADHLRDLIARGELKPGTRLPSIKKMAEEWATNYFTVQSALTPLANEGLIERSPRRGTFVRDRYAKLTSAGIYYGGNLWEDAEGIFYQKACGELQKVLLERHIRSHVFVDTRPEQEHGAVLPELQKAVERREIQGVLGMMLGPRDAELLKSREIPVSLFSDVGIHPDIGQNIDLALDRLAADGCRTVGLIDRNPRASYVLFEEKAAARGMTTSPDWFKTEGPGDIPHKGERHGYQSFKEIWSRQSRPDGLYIQHDWECRGAITAVLELGVRVPHNLRLVLYRNSSVHYVCPWPTPTIVLDTREVALAMVDYLGTQYTLGTKPAPPPLCARLVV